MRATKKNLIKALESINWSVKDYGCDHLMIQNFEGKDTEWFILSDRVFLNDHIGSFDKTPSCAFYFDECTLEWVNDEKTTISLTSKTSEHKGVYLMFSNHDLGKERRKGTNED